MTNNTQKEKYSEDSIISIFEMYRQNHSSPCFIEISGTPNSGKTSAVQAFEKLLKRCNSKNNKLKYKFLYEAADRCRIKDKLSPEFNIWTANETLNLMLKFLDGTYDIIVCERGLFDALCWTDLYYKLGKYNKSEYMTICKYFSSRRFLSRINMLYIMKCSVEESLNRENINSLTDIQGTIVNEQILNKYNQSLQHVYDKYKDYFGQSIVIDTSSLEQANINKSFVSEIFNFMQISY